MSVRATYRFARVPEWVLFHPDLDAVDVRVFATLDRYDGTECIPSLETIGSRVTRSADTVRRSIRRLEDVGAVRVESRNVEGRQSSNRYHLAGDAPMQGRPCMDATPDPCTDARVPPCTGATQNQSNEDPEQEDPETASRPTTSNDATTIVDVPSEAERLAHLLADSILERNPTARRPTVTGAWIADMDRLMRLDGRSADAVERVIRWLQNGRDDVAAFWAPNVRSPSKLRSRWDTMAEQHQRAKGRRPAAGSMDDLREYLGRVDPNSVAPDPMASFLASGSEPSTIAIAEESSC